MSEGRRLATRLSTSGPTTGNSTRMNSPTRRFRRIPQPPRGPLLLPKTFNASYSDLPYAKKLPHYLKQNVLAQSLNPDAYNRNPPLKKLIQAGLQFTEHKEFKKADIETRQRLYVAIAKEVWNPDRLNAA